MENIRYRHDYGGLSQTSPYMLLSIHRYELMMETKFTGFDMLSDEVLKFWIILLRLLLKLRKQLTTNS